MNIRRVIIESKYLWWAMLFAIAATLFIPAAGIKFTWVDDGKVILVSRQIIEFIENFNFGGVGSILFEGNGRFRIIYWLYQAFEYLIGGANPSAHFAVHFSVIFATTIFIFETVRNFTKSNFSGFFSSALYLLTPINTENIYRLGPVESILCLFIAASFYFLFKKKIFWSTLFLFLALYSKETAFVFFLPIAVAYVLKKIIYKKDDIRYKKYLIFGFSFITPILFVTFLTRSSYTSNYVLNPKEILENFRFYLDQVLTGFAPFLGLFVFAYFIRLLWLIKKGKIKTFGLGIIEQGTFILMALAFIAIQAPWNSELPRYLMPATLGIVIFLGIELTEIRKLVFLLRNSKILKTVGLIFLGFFIFIAGQYIILAYLWGKNVASETQSVQSMVSYVASNAPRNGKVLFNFIKKSNTAELVNEPAHLLVLSYNRDDVSTGYLNIESVDRSAVFIIGSSSIKPQYSDEEIERNVKYSSKTIIANEKRFPVFTTPFSLIKLVAKKTFLYFVRGEAFTLDGIYTQRIALNKWQIYILK